MTADSNSSPSPGAPSSPFAIPIFRAVWFASLASNFGGLIQSVGASWMMTSLAGSPQMVALVQSSTTLPIMLLALWAGAVADNFDRRKVMIAAQLFMLLVSVALSICAWEGWLTPWLLLVFTFLIGCGTALNAPAWQSAVGDMVPRTQLSAAVSLNSMGFNIARSVGPAVGGVIVATAGAAAAFLANAISYVGLIAVLVGWKPATPPRLLPRERLGVAMAAGLRYGAMSPNLRVVLLRGGSFGLGSSAVSALLPLVARDLVGGGALSYGLLLGGFGIGAVAGALGSGRLRRSKVSAETMVRVASLGFVAGLVLAAFSPWLWLTMVAQMLSGAGFIVSLSSFNVTVQLASPRWVVARALSLYQMVTFGGMAIGAWIFGLIAEYHGVSAGLLAGAGTVIAATAIGFRLPLPQVEDLNLDPIDRWREPDTEVPVEPRSGPVVITLEYRIEAHNIVAFLAEMNERRRIRRRDGAHGWTLLRDLHDPELWIERYHVATWLDYVRHNQRRTFADAENSATLHALQKEGEPFRVHRMIERQTGSLPVARRNDPVTIEEPMTDPTRSS